MTIAYLDRAAWGASPLGVSSGHAVDPAQFVGLVLHHTVFAFTDRDRDSMRGGDLDDVASYMRVLQHARPDLGDEVPYSWVVFAGVDDDSCVIAEGRGRGRTGAHTAGLNSSRYGIAVAGNTDTDQPMTAGMIAGIRWLAATVLVDPDGAVGTIGHQQAPPYYQNGTNLNATGCPGGDGMAHLDQLQPPFAAPTTEDDHVTPAEIETIAQRTVAYLANPETNPGTIIDAGARAALARLDVSVNDPTAGIRTMVAALRTGDGSNVDVDALAAGLAAELGPDLGAALVAALGAAISNG